MGMNLVSDNITVFPAVNSRDNGKLLLEENVYNIVRRITELNYVYKEPSEVIYVTAGSHEGFKFKDGFNCNIHGYDIILNEFTIWFADISEKTSSNEYDYVFIGNDTQTLPFGLALSKTATSPYRLKGDMLDDSNQLRYRGVEILIGSEFELVDEKDKLQLGIASFNKSGGSVTVASYTINYNTLIIDGSKIMIKDGDNIYSLSDYYVSKMGNNFMDNSSVKHISDIYGSLMFRKNASATDFNIMLGTNETSLSVQTRALFSALPLASIEKGIILDSLYDKNTGLYVNTVMLGDFKIVNSEDTDTLTMSDGFKMLCDSEKIEVSYSKESKMQIRSDEEKTQISFGDYDITPVIVESDVEKNNLKVTDKLGSLGVVKYCDGECVDKSTYYIDHDHTDDRSADDRQYFNEIPAAYSEKVEFDGGDCIILPFADDKAKYDKLRYLRNSYPVEITTGWVYTANLEKFNIEEIQYGFYISNLGVFTPSAGAYDFNRNSAGEPTSISEKTGYEYIELPIEVSASTVSDTCEFYDYVSIRFEIPENLRGSKILFGEFLSALDGYTDDYWSDNTHTYNEAYNGIIDRAKINAMFLQDYVSGAYTAFGYTSPYPQSSDAMNRYAKIGSVITASNLCGANCILDVPNVSGNLYLVISVPAFALIGPDKWGGRKTITVSGSDVDILVYDGESVLKPTLNPPSGGTWTTRGYKTTYLNPNKHSFNGIYFGSNPQKYTFQSSDITNTGDYDDKGFITKFTSAVGEVAEIPQTGLNSIIYPYAFHLEGIYTTSNSYKSYRIHGYFDGCAIGGPGITFPSIPAESSVGYASEGTFTYNYECYRLIYELGFEDSPIVIKKIENLTVDGTEIETMYQLYREDEEKIIFQTTSPWYFNAINARGQTNHYTYFYVDDLTRPTVFFGSNTDCSDGDSITTYDSSAYTDDQILNNTWTYKFYTRTAGNLGKYIVKNDQPDPSEQPGDRIWFVRNFTVLHASGINFSAGKNFFICDTKSFFNNDVHAERIILGDEEELSTVISTEKSRFAYQVENGTVKPDTYAYRIDKDGITFEANPNDSSDIDVLISKHREIDSQDQITFNGLYIDADLKADRFFGPVNNDYADNLKCSDVSDYEPGDIICKKPNSDEYTISNYDLRKLVVGVYSDTYGHLLGGDKMDSESYVPVAVAGNVKVKVKGFINEGDLIEVSNLPGVGQKAMNPEFGTIVGKALESKDTNEVTKILMQVMLA